MCAANDSELEDLSPFDVKAVYTCANFGSFILLGGSKNIIFKFHNEKITIKSIEVAHGKINCLAFVINEKCAYASDINKIYKKDYKHFCNLKYFIIDCLRLTPHPSHFHLDEVLSLVNKIKPKKTILTNLHSDLDYNYLLKILPKNVKPAYDGLSFNI